ncbi:MAG: glycosyltransferase [Thermodesulfobacteriota bacterium]
MRILHVITGLNTGGAEAMLAKLVGGMDRKRFSSQVLCLLAPGPTAEAVLAAGVRVESLGLSRGLPTPAALARAVGVMRRFRPDVVQTWLYHADLLGLLAAKLAGVRRVAWNLRCSDMELDKYRRLTRWTLGLNARLSGLPDVVLANSRIAVDVHRRLGFRPRRWEVVPNGFDTDRYRPDPAARAALRAEWGIPADAPVVGMVARYDPMKGHDVFFAAAAEAARAVPGAHFVLCGDGVEEGDAALARFANSPGLAGAVRLLGRRDDVPRVMAALDVHVLSSSFGEGFPNVVGEAMSCGVPCVVTEVGDAAEVAGDAGVAVPPRNPRALAMALRAILAMRPEERAELSRKARQRVLDRYGLAAVVRRYEEIYEGLAG